MNIRCLFGHAWDGCVCRRCKTARNKWHDQDGCICKRCGKPMHEWAGCKCPRCGKTRDIDHNWVKNNNSGETECTFCGAIKRIKTITCPLCDGLGADPATYSQQSGQGGSNVCRGCGEEGTVTVEEHTFPKGSGDIYVR